MTVFGCCFTDLSLDHLMVLDRRCQSPVMQNLARTIRVCFMRYYLTSKGNGV
jgi:hypothetical protein